MMQNHARVGRFLTSEEAVELARIQKDNSVIGYAVLTFDGEPIESSGAWSTMLGPVFANIFDISDRMGQEFGEEDGCQMLFTESPDFEIAGIQLSRARAIVIKRKVKRTGEGLRSVG
jgi:hypothetical protein